MKRRFSSDDTNELLKVDLETGRALEQDIFDFCNMPRNWRELVEFVLSAIIKRNKQRKLEKALYLPHRCLLEQLLQPLFERGEIIRTNPHIKSQDGKDM